jgi:putative transposase
LTMRGKPHVERTLESVASLFAQFVSGYLGRSVEYRGSHVEREALWSMTELQELLDEWIVAGWQNRQHDGLRDPSAPGRKFTPNEKYAALVEIAGYVPVALSADDYIELLPATFRAINSYGIKISHRIYDSGDLAPFRGQRSGVTAQKNLWEVHRDPYDVSRIWVRDHWHEDKNRRWITVFWKQLTAAPVPFGELAWDHARRELTSPDGVPADERQIAAAVNSMLRRADQGPPRTGKAAPRRSAKDRRVAARTKATAPATWPEPSTGDEPRSSQPEPGQPLADVVPLGVFDARKEARRRW